MTKMLINGSETGTVRLFHLDLPPEAVERFTTQAGTGEYPLQYALGARRLRPAFVDVVAIRDLGEMSLSAYLAEAHQLHGAEFRQMKPRIDALKGHVVILPSQAFDHLSQELTIATPLRWVGSFAEAAARPRGPAPRSAAARGTPGGAPAAQGHAGLRRILTLTLLGLGVLVLLVLASLFRVSG
ncbi:aspartate carbamoyltransferase catalytic subunit [Salipiger sp. P9]|uniref:aspartate carbamoyltransferase catalytic subunit n=1 Tax=Salipiger pentaromativorans TaxID=2943193 RepID=UPI002157238B|nr:aspartate carbamoyltransferase catalytic subunit [Salipiger pentaromativorans]MCR8548702.1 aspartate carbamoyltransferase catalytic subunit [Salipiger pentaromativorans]